jgi:hypothetical protein
VSADDYLLANQPSELERLQLRLPLQFSAALEPRLLEAMSEDELAELRREADAEIATPGRWGTTFTLIQCWGEVGG